MGQIIGSAAKPKRCNANQLSQVPKPAAGEHILVSSDNSMNAAGQGNFDAYVVGDGTTAATALPIKKINKDIQDQIDDIDDQILVSDTIVTDWAYIAGLTIRTGGVQATGSGSSDSLWYAPVTEGESVTVRWNFSASSGTSRFGFSSAIPAVGVAIQGYKTGSANKYPTTPMVAPITGYMIVVLPEAYVVTPPYSSQPKGDDIGKAVYSLQGRMTSAEAAETAMAEQIRNIGTADADFANLGAISDGTDTRYPEGTIMPASNKKYTDYIMADNVDKIIATMYNRADVPSYGIAFYDESKAFISGVKVPEATILHTDFPTGTYYFRLSAIVDSSTIPSAIIYSSRNTLSISDQLNTFEANVNDGLFTPLERYWAVCGDSLTHANHTAIPDLPADDWYKPIDDYMDKGYSNARHGNHPNYAYYFCKEHRIQWANYGFGGTILGNYIPKYLGTNNLLWPFIDQRIHQFKEGVAWNYITILFGWNDNMHGPVYQRDKWLSATYGGDIGYPYTSDLIGTTGFATQAQKDACDALGDEYFFDAFLGTINDSVTDTFYGAYNYAIDFLLKTYPNAKIMVIAPYLGGQDRTPSAKMRAAVHAIAEKFSLTCFDFEDVPYWYFHTDWNTTPFANPDRQDGRWVKLNGETTPPTIEGFNRSRFLADSVHPTLMGYQWIADAIGQKLLSDNV